MTAIVVFYCTYFLQKNEHENECENQNQNQNQNQNGGVHLRPPASRTPARATRRTHRPVHLCEVCHRRKTKAGKFSSGASIRLVTESNQTG